MKHSIPEEQLKADDQTPSDCEDVGPAACCTKPAAAMPDRRNWCKAIVHHCVSKITLKRTIDPRSVDLSRKQWMTMGGEFPFSVYKKPALVSLDIFCLPGKRQTRPVRTQTSYHKALRGGKELQSNYLTMEGPSNHHLSQWPRQAWLKAGQPAVTCLCHLLSIMVWCLKWNKPSL